MSKQKLFLFLAQIAGFIGIGMLLGVSLSSDGSNSPYWLGGILLFLAAVLIGMSISSKAEKKPEQVVPGVKSEVPNQLPTDMPDNQL